MIRTRRSIAPDGDGKQNTRPGPENAAEEMNRIQQPDSAGKEQGGADGQDGRGADFEEAFPGRMTGEKDETDWNRSSRFLVARVLVL